MSEVKKFIKEYKKEIILLAAGIGIYRIGFNRGFNTSINAINALVNDVVDKMEITKF